MTAVATWKEEGNLADLLGDWFDKIIETLENISNLLNTIIDIFRLVISVLKVVRAILALFGNLYNAVISLIIVALQEIKDELIQLLNDIFNIGVYVLPLFLNFNWQGMVRDSLLNPFLRLAVTEAPLQGLAADPATNQIMVPVPGPSNPSKSVLVRIKDPRAPAYPYDYTGFIQQTVDSLKNPGDTRKPIFSSGQAVECLAVAAAHDDPFALFRIIIVLMSLFMPKKEISRLCRNLAKLIGDKYLANSIVNGSDGTTVESMLNFLKDAAEGDLEKIIRNFAQDENANKGLSDDSVSFEAYEFIDNNDSTEISGSVIDGQPVGSIVPIFVRVNLDFNFNTFSGNAVTVKIGSGGTTIDDTITVQRVFDGTKRYGSGNGISFVGGSEVNASFGLEVHNNNDKFIDELSRLDLTQRAGYYIDPNTGSIVAPNGVSVGSANVFIVRWVKADGSSTIEKRFFIIRTTKIGRFQKNGVLQSGQDNYQIGGNVKLDLTSFDLEKFASKYQELYKRIKENPHIDKKVISTVGQLGGGPKQVTDMVSRFFPININLGSSRDIKFMTGGDALRTFNMELNATASVSYEDDVEMRVFINGQESPTAAIDEGWVRKRSPFTGISVQNSSDKQRTDAYDRLYKGNKKKINFGLVKLENEFTIIEVVSKTKVAFTGRIDDQFDSDLLVKDGQRKVSRVKSDAPLTVYSQANVAIIESENMDLKSGPIITSSKIAFPTKDIQTQIEPSQIGVPLSAGLFDTRSFSILSGAKGILNDPLNSNNNTLYCRYNLTGFKVADSGIIISIVDSNGKPVGVSTVGHGRVAIKPNSDRAFESTIMLPVGSYNIKVKHLESGFSPTVGDEVDFDLFSGEATTHNLTIRSNLRFGQPTTQGWVSIRMRDFLDPVSPLDKFLQDLIDKIPRPLVDTAWLDAILRALENFLTTIQRIIEDVKKFIDLIRDLLNLAKAGNVHTLSFNNARGTEELIDALQKSQPTENLTKAKYVTGFLLVMPHVGTNAVLTEIIFGNSEPTNLNPGFRSDIVNAHKKRNDPGSYDPKNNDLLKSINDVLKEEGNRVSELASKIEKLSNEIEQERGYVTGKNWTQMNSEDRQKRVNDMVKEIDLTDFE